MDTNKVLKQLMIERNISVKEMASRMGLQEQSFRNKLNRGGYNVKAFEKMLEILDARLQVVTNDSNKLFD